MWLGQELREALLQAGRQEKDLGSYVQDMTPWGGSSAAPVLNPPLTPCPALILLPSQLRAWV